MRESPRGLLKALSDQDDAAFEAEVNALDGKMDSYASSGRRLVAWVAREGYGHGVSYLLSKGAEPMVAALCEAIFFPNYRMGDDISAITALVEGGAPVNAVSDGLTPLAWAASINEGGDRERDIVRVLLKHGADPNQSSTTSPVHLAVQRPGSAVLEELLKGGADPNALDDDCTAIISLLYTMRRAFKRDKELDDGSTDIALEFTPRSLKALLAHGADPKATAPDQGASPLLLAISCKGCPDEVVDLLCEAGPDTSETFRVNGDEDIDLLTYALLTDVPITQQLALVRAGFPLVAPYEILSGSNYLSQVAQGEVELCELLWERAGDPFRRELIGFRNASGVNSLVLCAVSGSETMVRALHQAGVSASEVFKTGKSVKSMVEEHAPAMLPLIKELAGR